MLLRKPPHRAREPKNLWHLPLPGSASQSVSQGGGTTIFVIEEQEIKDYKMQLVTIGIQLFNKFVEIFRAEPVLKKKISLESSSSSKPPLF